MEFDDEYDEYDVVYGGIYSLCHHDIASCVCNKISELINKPVLNGMLNHEILDRYKDELFKRQLDTPDLRSCLQMLDELVSIALTCLIDNNGSIDNMQMQDFGISRDNVSIKLSIKRDNFSQRI